MILPPFQAQSTTVPLSLPLHCPVWGLPAMESVETCSVTSGTVQWGSPGHYPTQQLQSRLRPFCDNLHW